MMKLLYKCVCTHKYTHAEQGSGGGIYIAGKTLNISRSLSFILRHSMNMIFSNFKLKEVIPAIDWN
jgi:hypothetical protein